MSSQENRIHVIPTLTHKWVPASPPAAAPQESRNHFHENVFPALEQFPVSDGEPIYPTGFGSLTFGELYAATSRFVGFALRDRLGMVNPQDVDDCMQSGYLKVWQQLQHQPDLFVGKPKKYVVQAIVMRSKAQRYAHLRYYRKLTYDTEAQTHQGADDLTISQVETWIDLAQAIQRVAAYTADLDNPVYLYALYALITDVKTQTVAQTMRHGLSTLTAAKRRMRVTLAHALPHYGTTNNCAAPLALPKIQPFHLAQLHRQLITPLLLEDIPLCPNTIKSANHRVFLPVPAPHHLNTDTSPNAASEVCYETRWRETVTFEELLADTAVRKVAFAKMRSLGYIGEDAQDCFQLGTINLWKALQTQPELLADKGAAWVGIWIAHAGSRRSLWKHRARSVPLHDPELSRYTRPERWASWATRVDKRIDFTLLMNALAQRYDGDPLKLFALYSLTTSATRKDVTTLFGIPLTKFRQDIIHIKQLLTAAFRKGKSDTSQAR